MKVECAGLNFKIIFSSGNLIIKSKSLFFRKNNCITFSLNEVKLIELSTKSIIQPFISFLSSLTFLSFSVISKILLGYFIIVFSGLVLIASFLLILTRLIFGTLKIELINGKVFKVKFVKRRRAEEFISKVC
ncbi:hypothetical protein KEJ50_06510 [Candidatus Bathyarchaeota archaeon]|nr:hypothetical protein [Candidatus Bathyarchaeota archaeon]